LILYGYYQLNRRRIHGSSLLHQRLLPANAHALLARYFYEKNLFQDLDFSAMKEGNPALFDAWLTLQDNNTPKYQAET
jgi:hypothetical protein